MSSAPLFISAEQCQELLSPSDVIAEIRRVLEWDAAGKIQWPVPRSLNIAPDKWGNDYHMKAAVLEEIPVAGLRLVSHPLDESSPQCTRLILLVDPSTTLPIALVDETWNYAQRTVASIVVAAHSVANPGSKTLAIIGAGRMARHCVTYYTDLFGIEEIRVASRTAARRDALVADLAEAYPDIAVHACESAEVAVRGAELVLTATSADHAVIEDEWVSPGAVVAAVGTAEPGRDFTQNADLFLVDSRDQLRKELIAYFGEDAPDWVSASVGEVVSGSHPGRTDPAQRALIITEGMASQDIALAYLASQRLAAH
jgi:ornithine cyclodeaminase/alanine dehydrogenase-like protein (mu-crystallin family)